MEVYLNIAETGKGVFGVEAAAQRYFGRSAAKLNTHQAVSIACVLPNPLKRNPKTVSQKNQRKYRITYKRTEQTVYPFNDQNSISDGVFGLNAFVNDVLTFVAINKD